MRGADGVVAIGDSLVNADRSWAFWLARVLETPLTRHSAGGATAAATVARLGLLGGRSYRLACVSVGVNDVLARRWSAEAFATDLDAITTAARAAAQDVVVHTLPLGLAYFPGAGPTVRERCEQANEVLRRSGVLVVVADDLAGPELMSPDRIHPTVAGQVVVADRAARLLDVPARPSDHLGHVGPEFTRRHRLRFAAAHVPKRLARRAVGRPF